MEPLFKQVKSNLAKYLTTKQHTIMAYQEFTKIIDRYEDLNLNQYTEMNAQKLIFNAAEGVEMKER